jgi:copper resistance protein C
MCPPPRLMLSLPLAVALALAATPAWAQPAIVSSTPQADATVAPTERIEMLFSETLDPTLTHASLVMTEMPGMAMHAPMTMKIRTDLSPDGTRLAITLAKPLPRGRYVVRYRAVASASDGRDGSYAFRVE